MKNHSSDFLKRPNSGDPFVIREGKYASLEDSVYQFNWAEESFLSGKDEKEMLRRTFDLGKVRYIVAFLAVAILILLVRVFYLQIIKGDYYYSLAEGNRLRAEIIEPKRGIIYDINKQPLVQNEANFLLYLIPNDLPKDSQARDNILHQIANVVSRNTPAEKMVSSSASSSESLKLSPENLFFYELQDKLAKIKRNSLESYQPLFIIDNLEYQEALELYFIAENSPGVFISNKIRRHYLYGTSSSAINFSSLASVLGYTGKINDNEYQKAKGAYSLIDYIGKTGLEYSYEDALKGVKGEKNIEVDALGRPKRIDSQSAPVDGSALILGIDLNLQKKSEEVLRKYLATFGKKRASVVIIDPRNGEIRTLISWPAYDNNLFATGLSSVDYQKFLEDPDRPLFNRAISGEFPAGSTIKPVMSAAALAEGVITENTTVLSNGGIRIGEWVFPDWKAGGHGVTDVKKAIAESVNTFFYYIGGGFGNFPGLGIDRMIKYFKLFGLGEVTGIDLPSEAKGFLPTTKWKEEVKNEAWYIGDTYHVAIGQGDLTVTPLQVCNYTAAIANGGRLYKPHLVSKIVNIQTGQEKTFNSEVLRDNFIKPEILDIVRAGMRQTVTAGSARSLGSLPVEAAGKTGTAQWSTTAPTHAWFTGFAPYNNPELAITVLVEAGGEGSSIATPIAREILQYYFGEERNATSTQP